MFLFWGNERNNIARNRHTVRDKAHKSRWTLGWLAGRSALPQLGVGNNKPSIFLYLFFLRVAWNKRRLTGEEPEIYQRAKKLRIEVEMKKKKKRQTVCGIRQKKEGWRRARPLLSDKLVPAAVLSLGVMHDPFPNDDSRRSVMVEDPFFSFLFLQLSLTSSRSPRVSSHLPPRGQAGCEAKGTRWKNGQLAAAGRPLPPSQC